MKKNNKKKINMFKLLRMMSITFVLVFAMFFFFKATASGSTSDSYVKVTVCPGDTLWNLSKKYYIDDNIQKSIYDIMVYNNLENSDLKPGMVLKIPVK